MNDDDAPPHDKSSHHHVPPSEDEDIPVPHHNSEIFENLDYFSLCSMHDSFFRDLDWFRRNALWFKSIEAVFVSNCVKKSLSHTMTKRPFRIMVVGGDGLVGNDVCCTLLKHECIPPENLIICSTSRDHFRKIPSGVSICESFSDGLEKYHPRLIFIACTAPQLELFAPELREHLQPTMVVCSFILEVGLPKLCRLLGIENPLRIIQNRAYKDVDPLDDDPSLLERIGFLAKEVREKKQDHLLCPLQRATAHQATLLGISPDEAQAIANKAVFGTDEGFDKTNPTAFDSYFMEMVLICKEM